MKNAAKKHAAVIFLISIFIFLKSFFLFKFHEFFWDESVYIGLGKYLFSFGDFGLWESIRPPLLSLFLGSIWKSGLNLHLFSEILIILFSVGILLVTYLIAVGLFNRKVGFISVFLLAFTPIFFKFSSLIMTSLPSSLFALIAIYLFIKKKHLFLVGLFAGLSFLTRYPQGIIILSLGIILLYDEFRKNNKSKWIAISKKLTSYASGILFVIMPFLIFNFFMYKNFTENILDALFRPFILAFKHQGNVFESVQGTVYNLFFYFIEIFKDNYFFAFFVLGLVAAFVLKKYRAKIFSLVIPLFLYILYFTLITNKQLRFSLVFIPIIAIFAAYGLIVFVRYILEMRKPVFHYVGLILIIVLLILTYSPIVEKNWNNYYYRASAAPEIVDEFYYGYISELNGSILISDPTSIAYLDKSMIGFYQDNIEGPKIYDENKNKAVAVIFHKEVYPCLEKDIVCIERNRIFFERLQSENQLVDIKEYYGIKYYIFT